MINSSTILASDNSKEEINKVALSLLSKVNKSGQFSQPLDASQIYTIKNGGYQIRASDSYAVFNVPMNSSAQTVQLPALSQSEGRTISVYTTLTGSALSSYGALTIKAAGNDLIDGVSSLVLSSPWLRCVLFALRTSWVIVEYQDAGSNFYGSWVKWADGTMECWGTFSGGSNVTVTVTTPQPFSNTGYFADATSYAAYGIAEMAGTVTPVSTTTFQFYIIGLAGAVPYTGRWKATGKWK